MRFQNFRFFILGSFLLALIGCDSGSGGAFIIKGSNESSATGKTFRAVDTPAGSPTTFNITLYKAWISPNADCSDPILLQDNGAAGLQFDMVGGPTLFTGNPPPDTYECLILELNDNLKFKADAAAVAAHSACVDTTTEFTFDVYRVDSDDTPQIDIDGVDIVGAGTHATPVPNHIFVFGSTAASFTTVKANGVAITENQFFHLNAPLVVPGQATYYWDATNGIVNSEDNSVQYCWIEEVSSGFR